MRVITFGTFDVFHVGHVNILERAKLQGVHLIVGVSSDNLNMEKKTRYPIYSEEDRQHIISSLRCVDEVFLEQSLELKGKFDHLKDLCKVIYLPRTPSVSTTEIIEVVKTKRN